MASTKILGIFMFVVLLSGCATSPEVLKERYERVNALHKKYENQLIDNQQPYAYISGVPHRCETVPIKASLFCAFVVKLVDEKKVEFTIPYVFGADRTGYFPISYSRLLLKIPAGTHNITIEGGVNRPYRSNLTTFKDVTFEAGKYYAITDKLDKNDDVVNYISEYTPDNRFKNTDKQYYKLTKTISRYVYANTDEVASE